jgi:hypothetical protein
MCISIHAKGRGWNFFVHSECRVAPIASKDQTYQRPLPTDLTFFFLSRVFVAKSFRNFLASMWRSQVTTA